MQSAAAGIVSTADAANTAARPRASEPQRSDPTATGARSTAGARNGAAREGVDGAAAAAGRRSAPADREKSRALVAIAIVF